MLQWKVPYCWESDSMILQTLLRTPGTCYILRSHNCEHELFYVHFFLGKNKKACFPIRVDSKVLLYNYFHFVLHFLFIKWDIKGRSNLSYCDLTMKKTPVVKLPCLPCSYCSCRMLLPLHLLQRWNITSCKLCEVVFFRWIKEKNMKKMNEMQTEPHTNKENHVWRKYGKAHWYQLKGSISICGREKIFWFPGMVEEDRWRARS